MIHNPPTQRGISSALAAAGHQVQAARTEAPAFKSFIHAFGIAIPSAADATGERMKRDISDPDVLVTSLNTVQSDGELSRRRFLRATALAGGTLALPEWLAAQEASERPAIGKLPKGSSPLALPVPHFPDRLHAFVWRNWMVVPAERLAKVVGTSTATIIGLGKAMGLSDPPHITPDQQRRSYITVIRRNWHLLPYDQLLELLGWSAEQMEFTLREDDFLYVKLGNLKPQCDPLRYTPPSDTAIARAGEIAAILRQEIPQGFGPSEDPLFGFVGRLSKQPASSPPPQGQSRFSPRYCYSYFALYGDPLLEEEADPYPEGYLAQLAAVGVDGTWLQGVLHKLSPFPWDSTLSARHEERLTGLRRLVERATRHGLAVYLYLNEPRSMPLRFFERRPELKGAVEGDHAALCTSQGEVQQWIIDSVAGVCRAVPGLAGLFTISASENFTHCWSHNNGRNCPRCSRRSPAEVVAESNSLIFRGIQQAGSKTRLIVWDWGWADDWAAPIIERLPKEAALMSVSEWSIPIHRGGIENRVGEYSISTVGPGPRARKHWELARRRGLRTMAKIQAGNTWEISAVPYIPALENVARHAANLLQADVDGLMLGWTLGGYPSPNLEIVREVAQSAPGARAGEVSELISRALERVATRRFGEGMAAAVVQAWREFSAAFSEFPFDGELVYNAPMQYGPSNLLWGQPTGYRATMVGFPYDDLDGWRGPYPVEVFITQFEKVAGGFEKASSTLRGAFESQHLKLKPEHQDALSQELNVAEAAAAHFRTAANQARFIQARRQLAAAKEAPERRALMVELERLLRDEMVLARRLYAIQTRDSRIGFEATNHYYYVPLDLAEKIVNCRDLLERWLPRQLAPS